MSFIAGIMLNNALPHFIRGITNESYPCAVGRGPVPNFLAGWFGLTLTALLLGNARVSRQPYAALISGIVGGLLMGLPHAKGAADSGTSRVERLEKRLLQRVRR